MADESKAAVADAAPPAAAAPETVQPGETAPAESEPVGNGIEDAGDLRYNAAVAEAWGGGKDDKRSADDRADAALPVLARGLSRRLFPVPGSVGMVIHGETNTPLVTVIGFKDDFFTAVFNDGTQRTFRIFRWDTAAEPKNDYVLVERHRPLPF